MGASLIVSAFLAFSLSLSWFSGDKENGMLEDTIEETRAEQEAINQSYQFLSIQLRGKEAKQRKLEGKLSAERRKQKKLKRELALEQRKMRMAIENGNAVDIEGEREKIRKEVEERASEEIARLEARILTIEQEKAQLEENARVGLLARADSLNEGKKDGEGWAQAEIARARAREAIAQYKALKTELEELRAAKETAVNDRLQEAGIHKKTEDPALVEAKAKRAALEARLKAAQEALKTSTSTAKKEEGEKRASARVLVVELDKATRMLRRKIELRDKTISELESTHSASNTIDDNEKQTLRSALEDKARRIAALEKALKASRAREDTLKANLEDNSTTITTERASDPVDKEKIDTLRARILSLQAKLEEVENKKQDFAEQARAKIEKLRKKTQLLETRNIDMEKGLKAAPPLKAKVLKENEPFKAEALKEGAPLKAEVFDENLPLKAEVQEFNEPLKAKALREGAPLKAEVFDENMPLKAQAPRYGAPLKAGAILPDDKTPGLQTGLRGEDLLDLQAQATSYLAQKMIDRNVELEAQLQDTRLQLAEAQSAYRDANSGYSEQRQFTPGREDTRAIITRYRKAATTITALNQRNVELEARASETARALAEAEAARFIIEKLQAKNLALEAKYRALEKTAIANEAAYDETMEVETVDLPIEAAPIAETPSREAASIDETAALPTPRLTEKDRETMNSRALLTPLDKTPSHEEPLQVASLEKDLASKEVMESMSPTITASTPKNEKNDKDLYRIVRSIEDMNYALKSMHDGSDARRPSLVEIHENIRNLKKTILKKVDEGSVNLDDIISYAGKKGTFSFYVIQDGDTPRDIAGKKEVYGDSLLWPLIYRYNQSRINQPDIITSSRLLIIYNNLPRGEKEDAIQKAEKFGDWDKWTKEDKRILIEDWIM
ncbi:MAG: hypothetical protein ACE5EZ_03005 [Thermodesulfobacteriota bacterium]